MKKIITRSILGVLLLTGSSTLVPLNESEANTVSMNQVNQYLKESASTRYYNAVNIVKKDNLNASTVKAFNDGKIINTKKLNDEILKLINNERRANNVTTIKYNPSKAMTSGVNVRANEVGSYFSHYRPNNTLFTTAFPASIRNTVKGENVMRRSYSPNIYAITSEKYLAEMMFNQWKLSKDHRANLLRPVFKSASLQMKIKYNAQKQRYYYYAVQVFVTK